MGNPDSGIDLGGTLDEVSDGVDLLVGASTSSLRNRVRTAAPDATTFICGSEWLVGELDREADTANGRLRLVDRRSR